MKQGGIVAKEDVPAAVLAAAAAKGKPGGPGAPAKLCVEDPLTGRDVAGGAHRIPQVRAVPSVAPMAPPVPLACTFWCPSRCLQHRPGAAAS